MVENCYHTKAIAGGRAMKNIPLSEIFAKLPVKEMDETLDEFCSERFGMVFGRAEHRPSLTLAFAVDGTDGFVSRSACADAYFCHIGLPKDLPAERVMS